MSFVLLVGGVVGLWFGTQLTIGGAVRLSERFGLSEGFVGLAILAIGTDLPEVVVAVGGSLQQLGGVDASGVIVGTSMGSVIVQSSLVIGIAGVAAYLPVAPSMIRRDGAVLVLALVALGLVSFDRTVTRLEGAFLFLAWGIYFTTLVVGERRRQKEEVAELEASEGIGTGLNPALSVLVGLAVVTAGAHAAVTGTIGLAGRLGVTQTLLGVVIVGSGTSLPELAISLRAASEKRGTMSVGNIVGSDIFDLLVPVGVAGAIHPLRAEAGSVLFDLPALAVVIGVLLFFLQRRRGIQRSEALVLIGLYAVYVVARVGVGL